MAIAIRGTPATGARGTGTGTITATPSETAQDGDVVLVFLHNAAVTQNTFGVVTPPSGFNLIGTSTGATGWIRIYAYYKLAGASEPSSYAFGWSVTPDDDAWAIVTLTGVDTGNVAGTAQANQDTASNTTYNFNSVTTTQDDSWVFACVGPDLVSAAHTGTTYSAWSGSFVEIADSSAEWVHMGAAYKVMTTSGGTSGANAATASVADTNAGLAFEIRAAAAGGGTAVPVFRRHYQRLKAA